MEGSTAGQANRGTCQHYHYRPSSNFIIIRSFLGRVDVEALALKQRLAFLEPLVEHVTKKFGIDLLG